MKETPTFPVHKWLKNFAGIHFCDSPILKNFAGLTFSKAIQHQKRNVISRFWPKSVKYAKMFSLTVSQSRFFLAGEWEGVLPQLTENFLFPLPPIWFPLPLCHCSPLTKCWFWWYNFPKFHQTVSYCTILNQSKTNKNKSFIPQELK